MSHLARRIDARLPDGHQVPEPLDRAWEWMEANGHGAGPGAAFITPCTGELDLHPTFGEPSATGWFPPGTAEVDRVVPFGTTDSTGGMLAFWADGDRLRIVVLGSEGEAFVLVEDPVDLLRLTAIGYPELQTYYFTEPAEGEFGEDTAATVAPFRAWVEESFAVTVPEVWPEVEEDDEFTAWVTARTDAARAANEAAAALAPAPPSGARITADDLGGDAAAIAPLLGHVDTVERIAAFLALPDTARETFKNAGVFVGTSVRSSVPTNVTFYLQETDGQPSYRGRAFAGIEADFDASRVTEALGEPFAQYPWGLIYQQQGEGSFTVTIRVPDVGIEWVDVSIG